LFALLADPFREVPVVIRAKYESEPRIFVLPDDDDATG